MRIQPRDKADDYPLSFAQHRLWFIDRFQPGDSAYNVGRAVRLCGRLNLFALDQALTEIVRRHEVLRTTYEAIDGVPMQRIGPPARVNTLILDLSQTPLDLREQEVLRVSNEELKRPFDLAKGPPLRTLLLELAPTEHVLVISVHHIATDSMTLVFRELTELYKSYSQGLETPLPDLPIQYADYAVWERNLLTGSYFDKLAAYWEKQLAGVPQFLDLPTDLPRPTRPGTNGATYYFQMPRVPVNEWNTLVKSERSTLYTSLLAAWSVLLMRYTGQKDFLVSSPVACRELPELEPMIGCFANTMVLRMDLSASPSFREVLQRAARTVWGAVAHRRLPFHQILETARPRHHDRRSPLVQVNFRVAKPDVFPAAGLKTEFLPIVRPGSKFELAAQLSESMEGFLEYNTDLFSAERIRTIGCQFEDLLCSLLAHPETPVDSLDFLPGLGDRSARPKLRSSTRAAVPLAEKPAPPL
jgi:non-ribosomal peptide synthetase component F